MFRIMLVLLVASSTNLMYSCYENSNKNNDNRTLFATYLESLSLSSETDEACSERIDKYTSTEENSIALPQNASLIMQPTQIDTKTTPGSFALKKPWQMIFRSGNLEEQILWNKYPDQVTTEQINDIHAQSYAIASDLSKLAIIFEYSTLKWKGMGKMENGSKILVPIIKEYSKKLEIFNLKTLEIMLQKNFQLADQSRIVAISPGDSKEVIIKGMQNSFEEEKLLLFSPTENQLCVENVTKNILPENAVHATNFVPYTYRRCDFNRQGDALFIDYHNPYFDSSFIIKKPDTEFSTKRIFAPTLVNKE